MLIQKQAKLMAAKDEMITCNAAAKILDLTPDYIRRLCGLGRIKAEKLGSNWIMKKAAIKNIRRQRKRKGSVNAHDNGISE